MAVIKRDHQFEPIIQTLDKEKIFGTIAEMLTSFSYLGFASKKRLKLKKPQGDIKEETFISGDLMADIHLIALAETEDPRIILDNEKCIKIFEEYANGGLSIVSQEISSSLRDDPMGGDTLVTFIHKKFKEYDVGNDDPISL